jgi:putative flippase GtrA
VSRIEIDLPDSFAQQVSGWSSDEVNRYLDQVERFRQIGQRQQEARLRNIVTRYLLVTGTVILAVSLLLIVFSALGRSHLPDSAVATLIGSVAVEFVGMLYLVVKYLFREER